LTVVQGLKVIPLTNGSSNNSYYSACYLLHLGHPFKFSKVHNTARALKTEYFLELYLTAFFSSSSSLPHQPHIHSSASSTTVHRFNYSTTLTTIRHHRPTRTHIPSKENHYPPPHHSSSRCNSEPLLTALWLVTQFKTTQALPVDTTTTMLARRLVVSFSTRIADSICLFRVGRHVVLLPTTAISAQNVSKSLQNTWRRLSSTAGL
jgi:hypothetical protein